MRLTATQESAEKGEVSALAVVETFIAVALFFYLSYFFETLTWFAITICVAPLLLLKTEESVKIGCDLYGRLLERQQQAFNRVSTAEKQGQLSTQKGCLFFLGQVVMRLTLFYPGIIHLVVRLVATAQAVLRHPWKALQAIPRNWMQISFATDMCVLPELIPGREGTSVAKLLEYYVRLKDNHWPKRKGRKLMLIAGTTAFILRYLPRFLPLIFCRWSLKATTVVFAPFVFVLHSTFNDVKDLQTKLRFIKSSDFFRVSVAYAFLFIVAFLVKLVLMLKIPSFAVLWNNHSAGRLFALYIVPEELPKWQVASLINSFLTIALLLLVRHTLLRFNLVQPVNSLLVQRALGFITGLRAIISVYTVFCMFYITLDAAQRVPWPKIGEKWVPW